MTVTHNERRLTKSTRLRSSLVRMLLLSTFRVTSINYYHSMLHYLVCSLPIHKICALCGIFSAISVLLTPENSDDFEIRVPDESRSVKLTPVNFSRAIY